MKFRASRRGLFVVLVVGVGLQGCSGLDPITETVRETVEFESLSFPGRLWDPLMPPVAEGVPVTVGGTLTIPPTDRPLPAVIITHGCGGISGAESGWARELEAASIATLLINGFSGRGVSELCTGAQSLSIASMLHDLYRAGDALRDHRYIDGSRLGVLGVSFGGRTALWSGLQRFQQEYEGEPFSTYLAFYPAACYLLLENEQQVTGGPIRIFHGAADDWLPIGQCRSYVERLQGAGVDAALFEYQGAHHGFDDTTLFPQRSLPAALSPRNCLFVEEAGVVVDSETGRPAAIDSPCVESGVTVGFNSEARRQAVVDVLEFLEQVFSQPR